MHSYSIVLPCYNEAGNLKRIIERFREYKDRYDFELIVVNNGSTDTTNDVIEELAAKDGNGFIKVCQLSANQGYGHGIRKGLEMCSGDILAYTHADDQTPPEDVFRAFDKFHEVNDRDRRVIVKGERTGREKEFYTTRGLSLLVRALTGVNTNDVNGQPKVFGRELLGEMTIEVNNFGFDPYVLVVAKKMGWEMVTIDVEFMKRGYGESKSAGSLYRRFNTIIGFICTLIRIC